MQKFQAYIFKTGKIEIEYDDSCEMLAIRYAGKSIFYGNYCDFDRNERGFKVLFRDLGFDVKLKKKNMENGWEVENEYNYKEKNK